MASLFELQCSDIGGKYAVAARDIAPGEWVAVGIEPFALSVAPFVGPRRGSDEDDDSSSSAEEELPVCQSCYSLLRSDSRRFDCTSTQQCGARFCSAICRQRHHAEEAAACAVKRSIDSCQRDRQREGDDMMDGDEQQFLGLLAIAIFNMTALLPPVDEDDASLPSSSSWERVLAAIANDATDRCWKLDLVANWEEGHAESEFHVQGYQHMLQLFRGELAGHLFPSSKSSENAQQQQEGSSQEGTAAAAAFEAVVDLGFLKLCAALQCNSFSIYHLYKSRQSQQQQEGAKQQQQQQQQQFFRVAVGAYLEASYFNHSCVPNVARVLGSGPPTVAGKLPSSSAPIETQQQRLFKAISDQKPWSASFVATRPIAAGEPLCISYVNTFDSLDERQAECCEHYCFECACSLCTLEKEEHSSSGDDESGIAAATARKELLLTPRCCECVAKGYLVLLHGAEGCSSSSVCVQCGHAKVV